jgi:hypothetical protein
MKKLTKAKANILNVKKAKAKRKKYIVEDAEYGVDSRYVSDKERELDGVALMEARLIRMKNLSKNNT